MEVIEIVNRRKEPLKVLVEKDEFTAKINEFFDFDFDGNVEFYPFEKPKKVPKNFRIGLIIGASGTGKSTLLKEFGVELQTNWEQNKPIASHFVNPEEAIEKLSAVGLNSIPTWVKPYEVLSNGEKFRADLARKLQNDAVIDEFTSVVDRNVAKAAATSISKYIKTKDLKNIVFASCHDDIVDWLEPDWVFDANEGVLYNGQCLRRPKITLEIYETKNLRFWETFKSHHYLSASINKAARKFVGVLNGEVVCFNATLPMPSGTLKNAFRGHRTVLLPDYQGLGLGVRFSDAIGQIHTEEGKRYYSKTSHIRMGEYREKSEKWRPTVKNKKKRRDSRLEVFKGAKSWKVDINKVSYSHEYVGNQYDGDRECPDCGIDSLVEKGLTEWECLKCNRIFTDEYLDCID